MTPTETIALMNPIAACVAGMIASLHCVGMCGPLGCAVLMSGDSNRHGFGVASYQLGRVISYSLLGGLAGVFGGRLINEIGGVSPKAITLALVVVLLMLVFRLDRRLARFAWVGRLSRAAMTRTLKTPPSARGLALGLATPLLPCGLLYSMIWVAALSGSAYGGALIMASFCLGSMPALVSSLLGFRWMSGRLSPNALVRWQQGIALVAIMVLVARSFIDIEALMNGDGFCLTVY